MWVHFWHLFGRILAYMPSLISQNWLAILWPLGFFIVREAFRLRSRGLRTVNWKAIQKDSYWMGGFYLLLFAWAVIHTVYQDHQNLSREIAACRKPIHKSFYVGNSAWASISTAQYVLTTNSTETPVKISVACEIPIKTASVMAMSEDGYSMGTIKVKRLSESSIEMVLESPAWTPIAPLQIEVMFPKKLVTPLSQCEVAAEL
jgi:hypothetical protein